jgi:hypothetical protein
MSNEKPGMRIVAGTDVAKRKESDVDVHRIDELLSSDSIDLKALAQELGQFGPITGTRDKSPQRISLMITQEQRQQLVILGYTEQMIRNMTPTQAHSILRLT